MNFDPNMMNPEMMKNMMESFSQMSDDQLSAMMSSRGMGDISPSKMPKGKKMPRRDDTDFTQYAGGGKVGLYANIHAKRARGDKMHVGT